MYNTFSLCHFSFLFTSVQENNILSADKNRFGLLLTSWEAAVFE